MPQLTACALAVQADPFSPPPLLCCDRHYRPHTALVSSFLFMSAPAEKPKECEYRIFFPITEADASAAFSLFDASSFALFQPTHSVPPKPQSKDVEQRDDLYLIDPDLPHMAHYGLKLRGAQSSDGSVNGAASLLASCMSTPHDYKLELKILKSGGPTPGDTPSSPHSAAHSMSSLHAMPAPEEWKKVVRATTIHSSFQDLLQNVMPPIHSALQSAKLRQKHKQAKIIAEFEAALQSKVERSKAAGDAAAAVPSNAASAAASLPFRLLEVQKSRSTLSVYNGEQTDVAVTLLNGPQGAPVPQRRWRSICFEGSDSAVQSNNVRQLFQHLLQTHGDARGVAIHKAGEAGAKKDASSAAAAPVPSPLPRVSQGAFIGGYPEFLLYVLHEAVDGTTPVTAASTPAAN